MSAEYEYTIIKKNSNDDLVKEINKLAAEGWEPVNAYYLEGTRHAALLRLRLRPA